MTREHGIFVITREWCGVQDTNDSEQSLSEFTPCSFNVKVSGGISLQEMGPDANFDD